MLSMSPARSEFADADPLSAEISERSGVPSEAELEASGALIGTISFDRNNVFDTTQPGENNSLYRLANRWHIVTREANLLAQLLFRSGDQYSKRVIDESARLLRRNEYLYDAKITPVRFENGVVDLLVWTRDVWTLVPELSVSRTGGENKSRVALSEQNLLGHGSAVRIGYEENVDRDSTSLEFFDRNLLKSRTGLFLRLVDSSDGNAEQLNVVRPFFALNTRWAAGVGLLNEDLEARFYDLGNEAAEYRQETERYTLFGGWSAGLRNGWVRRWTLGLAYDDNQFSEVPEPAFPPLIPEDRRLVYPFVSLELLEDVFQTSANRDQIERTEDFYLGTRLTASLGYASTEFDSDRDALIYSASVSNGFGSIDKKALLLSSTLSGRREDGTSANTLFAINTRFYSQQSKKRLFFLSASGAVGQNLDLDNLLELGGDTGLRGYPLRYQTGDARVLLSIEERYFTDWYPFRLLRVGFAAFADVGRTWGDNPVAGAPLGWLKDVGVGLRLAPTRASGRKIYHIDVAFPLDGDSSIDSVQFLLQSKTNF